MHPLTSQAELNAFCAQVSGDTFITVDTEFIREKTYFPKLCLLQIAGAKDAAVIDPLASLDLTPVFALLQKPDLLKVFHAARQDIEIFYLLSGKIPHPIFDTQIAAAVCGYGESIGYEALVNQIVGAEIDKSSRFTDWAARPLSEKQLKYALSDVTHLRDIYTALNKKIIASDRARWMAEEDAKLTDPAIYNINPDDVWKRLRYGNMRPKNLAVLRELAKWRELEARKADVPRGRIVKDETLIELAFACPHQESDLQRLRGVERNLSPWKIDAILRGIETALATPSSEYPKVKRHDRPSEYVTAALPMLQLLLKLVADSEGIAAHMIAGKDELEIIAMKQDAPALHGWRYDIFGKKAQALMDGKLKLSLDPKYGKVRMEE
jgi:ribonuclease D